MKTIGICPKCKKNVKVAYNSDKNLYFAKCTNCSWKSEFMADEKEKVITEFNQTKEN